jgi:hypothetical protein
VIVSIAVTNRRNAQDLGEARVDDVARRSGRPPLVEASAPDPTRPSHPACPSKKLDPTRKRTIPKLFCGNDKFGSA